MTTKPQAHPESEAPSASITANGKKVTIRIPWKIISGIIVLLLGGGLSTVGVLKCMGVASAAEVESLKTDNAGEHTTIRATQEQDHKMTVANDTAVKALTVSVGGIQSTMVKDVARREARRLTDQIKNRTQAERLYDSLVDKNIRRMTADPPLDPCGSLECD
jgi:hypothetical protein